MDSSNVSTLETSHINGSYFPYPLYDSSIDQRYFSTGFLLKVWTALVSRKIQNYKKLPADLYSVLLMPLAISSITCTFTHSVITLDRFSQGRPCYGGFSAPWMVAGIAT
jgi:hypothetical protein